MSIGKKTYEKFATLSNKLSQIFFAQELMQKTHLRLGRVECNLLQFLSECTEPVCMNVLAKQLSVSHSRITHLTDSLIKKGYITRLSSTKDRRSFLAEINDNGRKIVNEYMKHNVKMQQKLLSSIPEDKVEAMYDFLELYHTEYSKLLKIEENEK